jgi:DNA replication initiation complex subunit (GINS family)
MAGDAIGFSEISDVHRNERRSKTLTRLPKGFFDSACEYLDSLKHEYDNDASPSSPKNMMLQDNIKKLDKRIKEICEMRERKIALASLGSGNPPDNMTVRDRELFKELVEVLEHYRYGGERRTKKERVPVVTVAEPVPEPVECQTEFKEEEVMPEPLKDVAVVQVLEDVPPFVDVDNTYVLKKDDVVSLPNQFADLLSSKGKVRIIDA